MGLALDRIDHFMVTVPDLDPAYEAMTRLGVTTSAPGPAAATGTRRASFYVGGSDNFVSVEFLQGDGASVLLAFPVADLEPVRHAFRDRGGFDESVVTVLDGDEIRTLRPRAVVDDVGGNLLFVQYPQAILDRQAPIDTLHELPLKRIDHVAIVPKDFDGCTRYWTDVLGVPLFGELDSETFVLRQMKVGDLVVEILEPHDPASPLATNPPGLLRMIAAEVDDIEVCVEHARSRGFDVPDVATGALPGTVRATIDAAQLGGLSLQLLQYL
jgi:catechol 2,3-dioxygenase-like lactoylglutathione lyase family enzyme